MKSIIVTLLAILPFLGNSQETRYGFTSSIGYLSAKPEVTYANFIDDYATHEIKFLSGSPIINAGVFGQKVWGWTYLRTDLVYSQYSLNYDIKHVEARQEVINQTSDKFKNLDLQVFAGIYSNGVRIGMGTVVHYQLDYNTAFSTIDGFEGKSRNLTNGILGNIGVDIANFSIDFRYERALKSIGDHIYLNGNKSRLKETPDQMSLAVSYSF